MLTIKLNSVTYALKANSLLKEINVESQVKKNPYPQKGEGCGYILVIKNPNNNTIEYLKNNGVPIKEAVWY